MKDKINKVTEEITRFLACAEAWKKREMIEDSLQENQRYSRCYNTKEGGALRRASLDLSRALAEMRRYP